jgi:RNA polymerase sigma-70 factor (ECF subfamily)
MYAEASDHLIQRARHNPQAFGEIYDMYLSRVYAFCLSRIGNREEAEDLTAQTFERALSALDRYESRGAPMSSWFFRIAGNLIVDRGRRTAKVVNLGEDAAPEQASHDVEDNPEQVVERWERAALLRDHIASLPSDQQEAVRLRYWEGYSTADLAQHLGRSEGAVKQLLHRALVSLRAQV